jgi:uncharacterized protein HemX
MDNSIALLICVAANLGCTGFAIFLCRSLQKNNISRDASLKQMQDFAETNAEEQAEALTALAKLVDKEFGQQLESLQKMQEYNESVFAKLADEDRKLYEGIVGTQNFLNKMAEGLGFRTRSNLDDL